MNTKVSQQYLNILTYEVIGASIEVHKIPVVYKSKELNIDFRRDLLVQDCLVVELKTVSEIISVFEEQLLTYMELLKAPKGILLNFNSINIFKHGQNTFVNEYFKQLPLK